MTTWNRETVCACGYHGTYPFHREVCPRCGVDKSEMHVEVCRWVDTTKWYEPWTWFSLNGYYESKGTEREARP